MHRPITMGITVKRARTAAMVAIASIVIISFGLMLTLFILGSENKWPIYITIPLVLIQFLTTFFGGYRVAGIWWCKWAYLNVRDVYELEAATSITGFNWYPPASLQHRHPKAYATIMQRFDEYVFVDDASLPQETIILKKRPWQCRHFLFFFFFSFVIVYMATIGNDEKSGNNPTFHFVLAGVFLLIAVQRVYVLSDRSPQMIFRNDSLIVGKQKIYWLELNRYEIIQGKESQLSYTVNGREYSTDIGNLSVSFATLNHLIFVYSRRHKRDNSRLYRNK